jgi:hypothetical protein
MADPFFENIHDGEWNACIGVQGEALNYVEGYLEAAQILVDTVIEKRLMGSRDTLAMPILFNIRHGLELALKFVLSELVGMGMAREREGAVDHDLIAYFAHLAGQSIGDREFRALFAALAPFVQSLGRIDSDGQELRYFENRDGQQSLGELATVNLPLIQLSIGELRTILSQLTDRVLRLGQENLTGTMTRECSRSDLIEIAHIIGARSTWSEDSFLGRKAIARDRFGLSGNGFSRALDVIQKSRDLLTIIGIETPLSYLTSAKILEISELWLKINPPTHADAEPRIISGASIDRDELRRDWEAAEALDKAALTLLSLEEFAELETIYYMGRDRRFGEEYAPWLERTIASHRLEKRRVARVHDIMSKSNFIDGLTGGLKRVGQPSLAQQVHDLRARARPRS